MWWDRLVGTESGSCSRGAVRLWPGCVGAHPNCWHPWGHVPGWHPCLAATGFSLTRVTQRLPPHCPHPSGGRGHILGISDRAGSRAGSCSSSVCSDNRRAPRWSHPGRGPAPRWLPSAPQAGAPRSLATGRATLVAWGRGGGCSFRAPGGAVGSAGAAPWLGEPRGAQWPFVRALPGNTPPSQLPSNMKPPPGCLLSTKPSAGLRGGCPGPFPARPALWLRVPSVLGLRCACGHRPSRGPASPRSCPKGLG